MTQSEREAEELSKRKLEQAPARPSSPSSIPPYHPPGRQPSSQPSIPPYDPLSSPSSIPLYHPPGRQPSSPSSILPPSPPPRPRPDPQLIRSPRDAEQRARDWMEYFGFSDAALTSEGADSGIDVISSGAVAQVKDHTAPVRIEEVQRLHGIMTWLKRPQGLFFARTAFTAAAQMFADEVGMALFRFDLQGEPKPINAAAKSIWESTGEV